MRRALTLALLTALLCTSCSSVSVGGVRSSIYLTSAADAGSTIYALDNCPTCSELNPLITSDASAIAMNIGLAIVVDWVTVRLERRGAPNWWLPAVVYSVLKGGMAINNIYQSRGTQ